ncbi:hypothetical protein FQZ97_934130 [compost metagenome]
MRFRLCVVCQHLVQQIFDVGDFAKLLCDGTDSHGVGIDPPAAIDGVAILKIMGQIRRQDVPVDITFCRQEELRLDRLLEVDLRLLLSYALHISGLSLSPGLCSKPIHEQLVESLGSCTLYLTNNIHCGLSMWLLGTVPLQISIYRHGESYPDPDHHIHYKPTSSAKWASSNDYVAADV